MASLGFEEGSNGENFANSHNGSLIPVDIATINLVDSGNATVWAYAYRCHLVEDNDGAPTAYGFDNPTNIFPPPHPYVQQHLHPLDRLADAASPFTNLFVNNNFHWAGLFAMTQAAAQAAGVVVDTRPALRAGDPDPNDGVRDKFPVVQNRNQPAPGYYVSTTAQPADISQPEQNPQRYWDASTIPYAVLSPAWATKRPLAVSLGDFGLAIRNDTVSTSGFFFADTGAAGKVGECARKLVRTLAANGFNEDYVTFLVFPGSGHGVPVPGRTDRVIENVVRSKINQLKDVTNIKDLALFLGGLNCDIGKYVEYVNKTARTDRPTDSTSRKAADALRLRAEPGTYRMQSALHQFGYLPVVLRSPPII